MNTVFDTFRSDVDNSFKPRAAAEAWAHLTVSTKVHEKAMAARSRETGTVRVIETEIPDVKRVVPVRHGDARGWFSETFRADLLAAHGIANAFVQDNQSFSVPRGTIRGLHFQLAPAAQAKLVRVLSGAILDVVVDLRRASPTFGRHVAVRLDAAAGEQLFVPAGFAHGFCTLEPDTMIAYKVDTYYSRDHDRAIAWNDPDIAIAWPVTPAEAQLSDKDRAAPRLADMDVLF